MRTAWLVLVLAAFVVLLAAIWLGSIRYWANLNGPDQRALYRRMVSEHALDRSERREVQEAMAGGAGLDDPRLRAAVVDWSQRALARDVELRTKYPRWSHAVVVLYVLAAGCLAAAVVLLFLDGRTHWPLKLVLPYDIAMLGLLAARPFLRRRRWQRAIDRNSPADDRLPAE
jgi:hypothetical protein